MELVYLWVEDYKNIKNQGFNFSPRFTCSYDKDTQVLTIDKKKEHVEDFFGKNINVTAIVGENGSGKSSVLEALYLMPNNEDKKIFYIYTFDGKIFYYQTNSGFFINSNNSIIQKYDTNISYLGLSFIPHITHKILTAKAKEARPSDTKNYKMEFIFKFIDVFKENNQVLKKIDEKFVFDKLKINIYRNQLISRDELKISRGLADASLNLPYEEYESFLSETYKKINKLLKNALYPSEGTDLSRRLILAQMKHSSGDLVLDIKISFMIQYMNNLVSLFSNIGNINTTNFDSVKNIFDDLSFENLFKKIKEFEAKINLHSIHLEDIQYNIQLVENWIQICEKNKDLFIQKNENYCLTLPLDNSLVGEILKFKKLFTINAEFNTFSLLDVDLLSYEDEINFFGLSSGEQKRLSLYIEIIDSYFFSESKILILDEPDTFLHPQWNKKFINDLLKALPSESKKHLILTSHSPFILSDIPKEHVIFLKDGKQDNPDIQQTFGANIHTLLSHGFFMDGGLMGEFAKEKINEVIEFHKKVEQQKEDEIKKEELKTKYEEKKKEFWHVQSIIGEDYLKQVIKNHLVEIEKILLGKDEAKKEEIVRLQKQIELLESKNA